MLEFDKYAQSDALAHGIKWLNIAHSTAVTEAESNKSFNSKYILYLYCCIAEEGNICIIC